MTQTITSSSQWSLGGNAGTNPQSDYIGTSDNEALEIRTNATQRLVLDTAGNVGITASVGINTAAPRSALESVSDTPFAIGPILTLTNSATPARNQGAALDFNTGAPGTGPVGYRDGVAISGYLPTSRICATSQLLPQDQEDCIAFFTLDTRLVNTGAIQQPPHQGPKLGDTTPQNVGGGGTVRPAQTDIEAKGVAVELVERMRVGRDGTILFGNAETNAWPRLGLVDASMGSGENPATSAPAWYIDNSTDNFRIFRQPDIMTNGTSYLQINNTGNIGVGTAAPLANVHVVAPALQAITQVTGVLIEAATNNNGSPRIGFVDTSIGPNTTAPAWFIDNCQDQFRVFRQPNVTSGGAAFLTIDNKGDTTVTGGFNVNGNMTITGDILLTGADCAERFDTRDDERIEAGTVVVIEGTGSLAPSRTAYDKRVAGVVSGAGSYRPGVLLDANTSNAAGVTVALVGKVYCKVDADEFPVEIGDLLTTSATPGHAMKAASPSRSHGATIGKALAPLERGCGLIPILAALQ